MGPIPISPEWNFTLEKVWLKDFYKYDQAEIKKYRISRKNSLNSLYNEFSLINKLINLSLSLLGPFGPRWAKGAKRVKDRAQKDSNSNNGKYGT